MTEQNGNLWNFHNNKQAVVVTTNGIINRNNEAVMGMGIALQAKQKFPDLPIELGLLIKAFGNKVFYFYKYNLFSFPVKHNWKEKAKIELIIQSCRELKQLVDDNKIEQVYLVRPGCGAGKLDWESEVKPFIKDILDNRFTIINFV
jgi:hypothetical protein